MLAQFKNADSTRWTIETGGMSSTFAGAPVYDFTQGTGYGTLPGGASTYAPYPKPTDYQSYPMYIMPLHLRAFAAQSSPFPCDDNTITIWVQTNVPLLKRCAPTLTVSGIVGTQTAACASRR